MRIRKRRSTPAATTTPHLPFPDEDEDVLPLQEFLDKNHPSNDIYMRSVDHVQRQIMSQTALLRPKQVQMVKCVFNGLNYTETALKVGCSPSTVSKVVQSQNGARLLKLLQYHLNLLQGANTAQRRNMAWRIAVDNEQTDPKVSLQAIKTLEDIDNREFKEKNPQGAAVITMPTVVYANENLTPTVLDQ